MTDKQHLNLILDAVRLHLDMRNAAEQNTRPWYLHDTAAKTLMLWATKFAKQNLKMDVAA